MVEKKKKSGKPFLDKNGEPIMRKKKGIGTVWDKLTVEPRLLIEYGSERPQRDKRKQRQAERKVERAKEHEAESQPKPKRRRKR